jgi:DNA anti-recombination protein RmuC
MCRELAGLREAQEHALLEASTVRSSAATERDLATATNTELQKRVAQLDQHATHLTDRLHAAEETARAAATTLNAAHAGEMHKLREAHFAELQVDTPDHHATCSTTICTLQCSMHSENWVLLFICESGRGATNSLFCFFGALQHALDMCDSTS